MSSYPSRLVLSLCLALALLPFLTGQSPSPQDKTAPEKGKQVRTDLCGDRLPEGAIARLGTNKFSAK
ncbi:MAG TPA: hypothetical protein VEL76_09295, partial [Gemmataceae bacterium]|nr:hypothetical protein [Gemmataceae bacterium]